MARLISLAANPLGLQAKTKNRRRRTVLMETETPLVSLTSKGSHLRNLSAHSSTWIERRSVEISSDDLTLVFTSTYSISVVSCISGSSDRQLRQDRRLLPLHLTRWNPMDPPVSRTDLRLTAGSLAREVRLARHCSGDRRSSQSGPAGTRTLRQFIREAKLSPVLLTLRIHPVFILSGMPTQHFFTWKQCLQ